MKKWFQSLSDKQKLILYLSIGASVVIIVFGIIFRPQSSLPALSDFSINDPIGISAKKLNSTAMALAKELGLPVDTPKNSTPSQLGVSKEHFDHAINHLLGHTDQLLKYYVYLAVSLIAFVYLVFLGKAQNPAAKDYKKNYPLGFYIILLILSMTVAGFVLGKSPNPMESIVKIFKAFAGLYSDPLIKIISFFFFIAIAIAGNKIICGWACPFGAVQELIYCIPVFKKLKNIRVPFIVSNTIRTLIFIIAFLMLFGIIGNNKGFVFYHNVNPFNLFNFDFDTKGMAFRIAAMLVVSLVIYRPYCNLVCPFGLISWIFERLSIGKIRVNQNRCTKCGACIRACPTQAAKGIVNGKVFYADCFSCTRCLSVCPFNAIEYSVKIKNSNPTQ